MDQRDSTVGWATGSCTNESPPVAGLQSATRQKQSKRRQLMTKELKCIFITCRFIVSGSYGEDALKTSAVKLFLSWHATESRFWMTTLYMRKKLNLSFKLSVLVKKVKQKHNRWWDVSRCVWGQGGYLMVYNPLWCHCMSKEGSEIRALRLPNPNVLIRATDEDESEPKSPSSSPVFITGKRTVLYSRWYCKQVIVSNVFFYWLYSIGSTVGAPARWIQ